MKRVFPQPDWPESWKYSYPYDLQEVYGEISCYGYAYAYDTRRKLALELIGRAAKPGAKILDVAAAQVSSLFVEPQQSGTGRALLKAAGGLIGRPFTLDCDLRNLAGLRAYERMGFSKESQISSHGFAMARLRSPKTLVS